MNLPLKENLQILSERLWLSRPGSSDELPDVGLESQAEVEWNSEGFAVDSLES